MMEYFTAIQLIAEQRITEAQARGEFDHLEGVGKPLPEENISHIPPELRMAWRVLKNAGYVPESIAMRKEIGSLADLLENCGDEKKRIAVMQRLRILLGRLGENRHMALAAHDEYYLKILSVLEKHERCSRKYIQNPENVESA